MSILGRKPHRHDGSEIILTINCVNCGHRGMYLGRPICLKGKAWKYIIPGHDFKRCSKLAFSVVK